MRDDQLLALRPKVETEDTAQQPAEVFQNETLRPILKLQNDLLLRSFRRYIHQRKDTFERMDAADQLRYIAHTLRTDQKFKNLLVGMIVGHLTLAEWAIFEENSAELTRRIVEMMIQRVQSQLEKLQSRADGDEGM
jgi:hypothetical protein